MPAAASASVAKSEADLEPHAGTMHADLWIVAALTLSTFALACAFELYERFTAWTRPLEVWQIDELPVALVALSVGMAWTAFRRARQARSQLQMRIQTQAHALSLLAHNRELAQQLLGVQESERRALARELHDELGNLCHAIRVEAAFLQHCQDAGEARAAVQRAADNAQSLVNSVRGLLVKLRPAELDALGLVAAMQALCEKWEEQCGVPCMLRHAGPLEGLGENVDTTLYRVAQEGLTNVLRHAQASQVCIDLQHVEPARVDLLVRDDGRGFDTALDTPGLGLLGATERAAALGGTLHVDSAPGCGTTLRLSVPLVPR